MLSGENTLKFRLSIHTQYFWLLRVYVFFPCRFPALITQIRRLMRKSRSIKFFVFGGCITNSDRTVLAVIHCDVTTRSISDILSFRTNNNYLFRIVISVLIQRTRNLFISTHWIDMICVIGTQVRFQSYIS